MKTTGTPLRKLEQTKHRGDYEVMGQSVTQPSEGCSPWHGKSAPALPCTA